MLLWKVKWKGILVNLNGEITQTLFSYCNWISWAKLFAPTTRRASCKFLKIMLIRKTVHVDFVRPTFRSRLYLYQIVWEFFLESNKQVQKLQWLMKV